MLSFKGMRFPTDVILVCIRWYAAYPLSYRHIEEMMAERGVSVDHSTITPRFRRRPCQSHIASPVFPHVASPVERSKPKTHQ